MRDAVVEAVHAGYRHIDCAEIYQNEHEVGEALEQVRGSKAVAAVLNFLKFKFKICLSKFVCRASSWRWSRWGARGRAAHCSRSVYLKDRL